MLIHVFKNVINIVKSANLTLHVYNLNLDILLMLLQVIFLNVKQDVLHVKIKRDVLNIVQTIVKNVHQIPKNA